MSTRPVSTSEAFQFGATLGRMRAAWERAIREMALGFEAAVEASRRTQRMIEADPEMAAEMRAERRYRAKIEDERRAGLAYVRRETDALRKRWGLS